MATKIDNQTPIPGGVGPGQNRSSVRAGSGADAGESSASAVPAASGGDRLELSGEAAGLISAQREISTTPPSMDEAKISALRAAVSSGAYQINPQEIAARLIALERKLA